MQAHAAIEAPEDIYSFVLVYSLYKYIFRFLHWLWKSGWIFVLLVMAVALAVMLLIWFGQKGPRIFWRLAALAVTILPSMGVLL